MCLSGRGLKERERGGGDWRSEKCTLGCKSKNTVWDESRRGSSLLPPPSPLNEAVFPRGPPVPLGDGLGLLARSGETPAAARGAI